MIYASVCSGIEAATVAWSPLGWKPAWFSEIAAFPAAVLRKRFPDVPNLGDMTGIDGKEHHGKIDLLVGGTPCQGFSSAGRRGGLDDPRSRLALSYVGLLDSMRPEWFVWENVPGVFSIDGGRAFKRFIREITELGYGLAWRVLDAQYVRVDGYPRAVPQRRRRVFVVGHSGGGGRRPAEVLLEPDGVPRDTPPLRGNPANPAAGTPGSPDPAVGALGLARTEKAKITVADDLSPTMTTHRERNSVCLTYPDHPAIGFMRSDAAGGYQRFWKDISPTQRCGGVPGVSSAGVVRRLTPRECERLMGFPDDWTKIPWRGKPAEQCPDLHRYVACGNSMCVNVMRWIGMRIDLVRKKYGG